MSAVRKAICEYLRADTGAGKVMEIASDVFPKQAPKQAAMPCVVVRAQQPPKGHYAFQGLDHEESRYVVTGMAEGMSSAQASELKKRIRARLHDAPLTVEGYETLLVSWVQDVEFTEPDEDGVEYQHEGGIYEVWTEPQ